MRCDMKTMFRTAGVIGLVAVIGYFAVPGARAFIVASAPVLIALICPVSMVVMMFMMNRSPAKTSESREAAAPEAALPRQGIEVERAEAAG